MQCPQEDFSPLDAPWAARPPHHGRPTALSTQIESNVVKTIEFYFYQGYALSKGTVTTMAHRIYNNACSANLISPSQKPPAFSHTWFSGFAKRHNLSQRLVESISDDRKAASTPENAESLFNKISEVIELHSLAASDVYAADEVGGRLIRQRKLHKIVPKGSKHPRMQGDL